MPQPSIEKVGDAIRVHVICEVCGTKVVWKHIELADDGRFLVGTCRCRGRRHRHALEPTDKVIDDAGKPI